MSEHNQKADETGRTAADKAGDKASSPSRRWALKSALASAPIIMSLKSRPALASTTTKKGSHAMSHNMSSKPSKTK